MSQLIDPSLTDILYEYESGPDTKKRKEEMERKSGVICDLSETRDEREKCMSVGGDHSSGSSEPDRSVMAVILLPSNETIILKVFFLSFKQLKVGL